VLELKKGYSQEWPGKDDVDSIKREV